MTARMTRNIRRAAAVCWTMLRGMGRLLAAIAAKRRLLRARSTAPASVGAAPAGGGYASVPGKALFISEEEKQRLFGTLSASQGATRIPGKLSVLSLTEVDRRLTAAIREQTLRANRNNVTRTAAYGSFYDRHPEVHWALLAHLVSRNGGYSMTDLRGDLVSQLLDDRQTETTFRMLERSNAFIFGDAYPQLLLYEESRLAGRPLFHLLSAFGVSRLMRPVWEQFWKQGNSALLTTALIANEQNFIQSRVVEDDVFRGHVLETSTSLAQMLLQLNQVVFPWLAVPSNGMERQAEAKPLASAAPLNRVLTAAHGCVAAKEAEPPHAERLYGRILEDFTDLEERIAFGRQLYALLYGAPGLLAGAVNFARAVPHTGSRADYWPHLYSAAKTKASPSNSWMERLGADGSLLPGAPRFYSPALADAWPDQPLVQPAAYDWCRDPADAVRHLCVDAVPAPADMTAEAMLGLRKVELAVMAYSLLPG